MSLQYARKKISDIQKKITYMELVLIHKAANSSARIPEGDLSYSVENKRIFISIDIASYGSALPFCPAAGMLRMTKSTDEEKPQIKIKFFESNRKLLDQVHLWEIYYAKRKQMMRISFLGFFILFLIIAIAGAPYLISRYSAGPSWPAVQYFHEKASDTLSIKRKIEVKSVEQNTGIERATINRTTNYDSSIISEKVLASQKKRNGFGVEKDNKNDKQPSVLHRMFLGVMFFFFLFIYIMASVWVGLMFSKCLIRKIFSPVNLFTNPDEEMEKL